MFIDLFLIEVLLRIVITVSVYCCSWELKSNSGLRIEFLGFRFGFCDFLGFCEVDRDQFEG